MIDFGALASSVFPFAAAAWVALAIWLLAGRALHDLQHRGVRVTRHRLVPRGKELTRDEHAKRARGLLATLPPRAIERLAADSVMPPWLAEPFAIHVLQGKGAARFLRDASSHRGERGRWRRIVALRILCTAGHPDAPGLLKTALLEGDPDVAGAAVSLLGTQTSRAAAELLVRALRERLYSHSRVAAQLDRFALDVPDLIMPLVRDADPSIRFWCATLLARYGGSPGVAAGLAALGTDADPSVRKAAVESLGVVGGPGAATTALRLLEDPVWYVRAHAARALGDLERSDLAPRVLPLLADAQWWVRAAAKDALQAMGPSVAPAVAGFLEHPDRFARNGAAEVLQNLGVLHETAVRAAGSAASADDVALLEKAAAAGIASGTGNVGRILPAASDRIRMLVAPMAPPEMQVP